MALRTFIIGMSHVTALSHALQAQPDDSIEVLNMRVDNDLLRGKRPAIAALARKVGQVDVLGLSIHGNAHNIFGLLNDPVPFWMAPGPANGQLVPQDMMQAHLEDRLTRSLELSKALVAAIPSKVRVVINPPPPAGDQAHITQYPGVFEEKLPLGVSPDAFRVLMYRLQSAIYERHARALDARFLPSPAAAADESGMLAQAYWNKDPTHGNAAYGALVLDDLRALIGELK